VIGKTSYHTYDDSRSKGIILNIHSDPGVDLSVTQGKTVDEEKIRQEEEPVSQWSKSLPFNRNMALLEIYI